VQHTTDSVQFLENKREASESNDKRRMASSGMLHHVALVRTDFLEELRASIISVTRISELGTTSVASYS
jgi:hypothetical protein